jgi:hypothetical protein
VDLFVRVGLFGKGGDAAAHLDGGVRHAAHDGRARQRGSELVDSGAAQNREHAAAVTCDLGTDCLELVGLDGEDDHVRFPGQLSVRRERLAPQLFDQGRRAPGAAVGREHRLAPTACQRTGHVAGADQPDGQGAGLRTG